MDDFRLWVTMTDSGVVSSMVELLAFNRTRFLFLFPVGTTYKNQAFPNELSITLSNFPTLYKFPIQFVAFWLLSNPPSLRLSLKMKHLIIWLLGFNFLFLSLGLVQENDNSFRGFKKGDYVVLEISKKIEIPTPNDRGGFNYRECEIFEYFAGKIEDTGNPSMGRNNFIRISVNKTKGGVREFEDCEVHSRSFTEEQVKNISSAN